MKMDEVERVKCYMFLKNKYEWGIIAIIALLPFAFFYKIIDSNLAMSLGDGIGYEIQFDFIKDAIMNGEFPVWNKYNALGTSFAGDIQNKLLYPLTWLVMLFPKGMEFKIFYIMHISMALVFSYILFRELNLLIPSSVLGSFFLGFSNMLLLRFEHINILCCIAWIPIILAWYIKTVNRKKAYYLLGGIVSLALQFYAGFPQIALYSDIFVLFFIFVYAKEASIPIKSIFKGIVLSVLGYGCLIMAALLPLVEIMLYSGRQYISYDYFADCAADIRMIFNLFNPVITGNWGGFLGNKSREFPTDTYLGITVLILLTYGIIKMRNNRLVRLLLIIATIALVMSSACNNFPGLGKALYHMPLLGSFRTTTRMIIFFVIPLIMIAALAIDDVIKKDNYKFVGYISLAYAIFWTLFILIVKVVCVVSPNIITLFYNDNNIGVGELAFCLILFVIFVGTKKINGLILVMLVVLHIADVYFVNVDHSADPYRIWRGQYKASYETLYQSDVRKFLNTRSDLNRYRYFVDFNTWEDLANTSWGIRPNGNIEFKNSMIQSYITFNNPFLLAIFNTNYGMMMNLDEFVPENNYSLMNILNCKYLVLRKDSVKNIYNKLSDVIFENYSGIVLNNGATLNIPGTNEVDLQMDLDIFDSGKGNLVLSDGSNSEILYSFSGVGQQYLSETISKDNWETNKLFLSYEGETDVNLINGIRITEKKIVLPKHIISIYEDDDYIVLENQSALEKAFLLNRVQYTEDAINYIKQNKGKIDFETTGIVDENITGLNSNSKGKIGNINERLNSINVNVKVYNGKSLLVVSESMYPGWQVYVDGKKQKMICVDGGLQGVIVDQGEHEVSFDYIPKTLIFGSMCTIISLIGILCMMFSSKIREAKRFN